jgi:hypothetical protein
MTEDIEELITEQPKEGKPPAKRSLLKKCLKMGGTLFGGLVGIGSVGTIGFISQNNFTPPPKGPPHGTHTVTFNSDGYFKSNTKTKYETIYGIPTQTLYDKRIHPEKQNFFLKNDTPQDTPFVTLRYWSKHSISDKEMREKCVKELRSYGFNIAPSDLLNTSQLLQATTRDYSHELQSLNANQPIGIMVYNQMEFNRVYGLNSSPLAA